MGVAAPVVLAVQGGAGARAARLPEIVPGGERRAAAAKITFRLIYPQENFLVKFLKNNSDIFLYYHCSATLLRYLQKIS